MTIPTISELEQQKREAHYAISIQMSKLNDEATSLQERLKAIQTEAQQAQDDYRINEAKRDAQIELLKAMEAKADK